MRKNFSKFLGVYLLALVGAILFLSSCDRLSQFKSNGDMDSISVAQAIEYAQNPLFVSIEDIVDYRTAYYENKSVDSVFFSLSPATIQNVASVLLDKCPGGITKEDIVKEYKKNQSVYDGLPDAKVTNTAPVKDTAEVDRTATDLGDRRKIISTRYSMRTDTIDGKPVKITIKTEEYYE